MEIKETGMKMAIVKVVAFIQPQMVRKHIRLKSGRNTMTERIGMK